MTHRHEMEIRLPEPIEIFGFGLDGNNFMAILEKTTEEYWLYRVHLGNKHVFSFMFRLYYLKFAFFHNEVHKCAAMHLDYRKIAGAADKSFDKFILSQIFVWQEIQI